MPIIDIQRRMAEQGRIRLGQKVATSSGKTRPDKLDRFRFTSPNERLINEVAQLYGGNPQPWDNDGKAEFEVITDARGIPVIVVKGGFSQWYEAWTRGGCQHRCDGEKDVTGAPCDPNDPLHLEATKKPTTRLSVMLSQVESLGVWRMETKGWNAAAELPSMAELAMHVGDLVPATLSLAERSSVIQTAKGPQTSRFVVPVLDLHVSKRRLVELVGGQGGFAGAPAAIEQPQQAAIEAAPSPRRDYAAEAAESDLEQVREIWREAVAAGHMNPALETALRQRVADLQPQPVAEPESEQPAAGGEPSWVADGGRDEALWTAVIAAGGRLGMTTSQVGEAYAEWTQGELLADASDARLAEFRDHLTKQAVPA